MNHAITGLLSVSLVVSGVAVFAVGAVMTLVGAMSAEGASTARTGCFIAIIGAGMFVGGLCGLAG